MCMWNKHHLRCSAVKMVRMVLMSLTVWRCSLPQRVQGRWQTPAREVLKTQRCTGSSPVVPVKEDLTMTVACRTTFCLTQTGLGTCVPPLTRCLHTTPFSKHTWPIMPVTLLINVNSASVTSPLPGRSSGILLHIQIKTFLLHA